MPVTFEERVVGVWGFVSGGVEGQEVLEKWAAIRQSTSLRWTLGQTEVSSLDGDGV